VKNLSQDMLRYWIPSVYGGAQIQVLIRDVRFMSNSCAGKVLRVGSLQNRPTETQNKITHPSAPCTRVTGTCLLHMFKDKTFLTADIHSLHCYILYCIVWMSICYKLCCDI
jgi:hypothetical protein